MDASRDYVLSVAIGLEAGRCAGRKPVVSLQRFVIDGLQRGANPPWIQHLAHGQLGSDDAAMSNPAQFALIARIQVAVQLSGTSRNREAIWRRRADRVHQ